MPKKRKTNRKHRVTTRRLPKKRSGGVVQRRKAPAKRRKYGARRKPKSRGKVAASRKTGSGKKPKKRARIKVAPDPRLEMAVKDMNRGSSLTAAARSVNLPPKTLQSFVTQRRLAKRKGGRWVAVDKRPRRVPVITKGRIRIVTVDGFEDASRAGRHYQAAGDFVRTNDLEVIKPFEGGSVKPGERRQAARDGSHAVSRQRAVTGALTFVEPTRYASSSIMSKRPSLPTSERSVTCRRDPAASDPMGTAISVQVSLFSGRRESV